MSTHALSPLKNVLLTLSTKRSYTLLLTLLGTLLLALSAQLVIPLTPVPLTFQSATAVLLGLMLGRKAGTSAVITYLLIGAIGAPVFAGFSAGFPILMGPTGGYLLGFLPAAWIGGFLAERGYAKHFIRTFVITLLAACPIFVLGWAQLAHFVGSAPAFQLGVKPFLATEIIKLALIALGVKHCWRPAQ